MAKPGKLKLYLHPGQQEVFGNPARFKVLVSSRRFGKNLEENTPILTKNGYKPIKEIFTGDTVYNEQGLPVKVLAATEVFEDDCYDIVFENGQVIRAGKNHEWVLELNRKLESNTWTTEEIFYYHQNIQKGSKKLNLSVPRKILHPWESFFIADVIPVGRHRTKCIQVEGGIFLCSKSNIPTHNSRLLLTTLIERAINYNGNYDKASPPVVLLVMPSLKQAKQIHWEPLVNILDGHPAVKRIFKSECRIVFKGNKPDIILRGANEDNGDNMRGLKIYFAGLDEMQDIKPIVWTEVIRPALVDTKNSTSLIIGCVNPNTKVLTPTGIKEIKDFDSDTKEKEYLPISEDIYGIGREFHKADGFFNNGIVETRKISTSYGFTLESSLNHPILTKDGWKKTGELEVGDKVAIDYGMEVWGNIDPLADFEGTGTEINGLSISGGMTEQLAHFLGWGIAQGNFASAFHNSDDLGKFLNLLKHLGMRKFFPNNQVIPSWLWNGKREWAVSFIKGYIVGAGLRDDQKRIVLRSPSKELLREMQLLLTNLGVVACLGGDGLVLNGFNPGEPLKNQDYYWDTIKTLEQSECQTFDFTIPETHSFWSNGFISHNTPKGAGTFFHSLYLQGGEVPNWASFLKTVYDNPFIPLDEIQRTKESLPEKIFRQEFLASWESFDGQIFSDLDKRHLLDDDDLPTKFDQVYIGVDWGDVNPALVVVGRRGAAYFVIDCWENPNPKAAIEQRVHNEKAIELARTHGVNRGYADPSQPGRILTMRKAGVPKLMEGYNRVSEGNGVVNTLLHQDKLFIAKSCKRVFEDMTAYHRESKEGNVTEKVAEGQRDHFCDALRYVLATLEHRNIENIIDSMGANTLIPSVPQDDSLYGNYNSGY